MKKAIINTLQSFKEKYLFEGFEIVGVFGSYAKNQDDIYSDIDIAYKIDHNKFYKDDAFKKLFRIEEIKKELEDSLHKKVDIVSLNSDNKRLKNSILKEMVLI